MVALSPSLAGSAFAPPAGLVSESSGTARAQSSRKSVQLHRSTAPERIAAFLRQRHPVKTAECVAAETGFSRETVNSWLNRLSAPKAQAMLKLVALYGPEFLCAAMHSPPEWLNAAARAERSRALDAEINARRAELDRLWGVR